MRGEGSVIKGVCRSRCLLRSGGPLACVFLFHFRSPARLGRPQQDLLFYGALDRIDAFDGDDHGIEDGLNTTLNEGIALCRFFLRNRQVRDVERFRFFEPEDKDVAPDRIKTLFFIEVAFRRDVALTIMLKLPTFRANQKKAIQTAVFIDLVAVEHSGIQVRCLLELNYGCYSHAVDGVLRLMVDSGKQVVPRRIASCERREQIVFSTEFPALDCPTPKKGRGKCKAVGECKIADGGDGVTI